MLEHLHHLSLHLRKGNDRTVERTLVCEAHLVHRRISLAKGLQSRLLDRLNRLNTVDQATLPLYQDRSRAPSVCGHRVENQAGRGCVLDPHLPKPKPEHRLHRLDLQVAPVSSAHNLIFGLKAQLYLQSRQGAGKQSQVLCNRVHKALLGKRALSDQLATHPKRDLESCSQRQMARCQVQPPVQLLAQRFLQAQGSDGNSNNNSSNSNKIKRRMYSRHHPNIDSSCLSCNLLPIESSHQFQIFPPWKQQNLTEVVLDLHALKTVNLRLLRVVPLRPRSILVMWRQSAE